MNDEQQSNFHEYARERDMDAFWEAAVPEREPINSRWYLPAAIGLIVVAAPWFWPAGEEGAAIAGLPVWVWVTIGATFALGALTAFAALTMWRDGGDE